jgi:hypothetical protein
VSAAVVLGGDFDVLVLSATITILVLDADVGKVYVAIEVGEVVLARPGLDLTNVVIRAAVTVPFGRGCAAAGTAGTRA